MPRLFFALWPNQKVRNEIRDITQQFPKGNGRIVPPDNIHITLVFLGQVGEQQSTEVQNLAARIQTSPFELNLEQLGWWRKSGILWLGTQSIPDQLEQLVSAINTGLNSLGYSTDDRKYVPHVTLMRDFRKAEIYPPINPICWEVERFVLVKSVTAQSGALYQLVDEWILGSEQDK